MLDQLLPWLSILGGLALLLWSADRFVVGASATARHFGMPPLVIGMVIVGFGTSAPELVVSTLAATGGSPGIALGNAYGSNICNIALILGLTAVISPLAVRSRVLRRELPILAVATLLAAGQAWDGRISRLDAAVLLLAFAGIMAWTLVEGRTAGTDPLAEEVQADLAGRSSPPIGRSIAWLVVGLVLLVVSSRLLVWGAETIARRLGVSDVVIGLTVIAVGTSLPELASSVVAARKGEHEIALGNVLGSNLFNTLAVVGVAGAIAPLPVGADVLGRDILVMGGLTASLFVWGIGRRGAGPGRINRIEGGILLAAFAAYTGWLVRTVLVN